ncbi:N-acetyltransferase [Nocardioides panacisoli]|uniref:GNAT family N-acetyltransferase n=1 Tax=Nocardioides panacisoli TaxID=627624 RepID=UPI001C62F0B9|nr:GNAT family N-acetyltransferase [Nocardioides panacisoli]QYJ04014.1 N-acetyltransferase [Nocardioides panacisoli]
MTDARVSQHAEQSRFEVHVEGRRAGLADYVDRDGVRDFVHTEVDDAFEGQGVGSTLIREALDHTRADGLRVRPTCPFVRAWIEKHPDHQDLLA